MEQQRILVEELETERKLSDKISVKDFFFLVCALAFSFITTDVVHPQLTLVYYLYNVLVAIFLTRPSLDNPGRRVYESIYYMLIKNRNVYKPVPDELEGDEKDAL